MKKLLLTFIILASFGSLMAQDCASFIRYYDFYLERSGATGIVEGNFDIANVFTNPPVTRAAQAVRPPGDTIVCAGNILTLKAGFDWIPSAQITVPDVAVDSFMMGLKSDSFGSGGAFGGLSGGASGPIPIKIFLDDPEGCIVEEIVPYPDMYFEDAVALILRNTCTFDDKTARAADAGADGVIIYNRESEGPYATINMIGDADTLHIPAWMTTFTQGTSIIAEIDLEERDVFVNFSDLKLTETNWTKNGAGFATSTESNGATCSDGPGQFRVSDFTIDIGCGPIAFFTDSVNQLVGPAPCGGEAICVVGIEDDILNEKVSVYPNPTTGLVTLSIGERIETEVTVYAINGSQVISKSVFNDETIEMDLSKLNNGIYLMRIKQGDAVATKRINVLK